MYKIQSEIKTKLRIADSQRLDNGVAVPCITGKVSMADVVSQNGYRYKKSFWPKILNDSTIQTKIKNHDMLGMIEHPTDDDEYMSTPMDKAAVMVMKAWVEDSEPYAIFGMVNNEYGNKIKALVDMGFKPGISTRGMGSFLKDDVSQFVDENNYCLITWDVVRNPNFKELQLNQVSDSCKNISSYRDLMQMYSLRDSVDDHYNPQRLDQLIDKALLDLKTNLFNILNQKV